VNWHKTDVFVESCSFDELMKIFKNSCHEACGNSLCRLSEIWPRRRKAEMCFHVGLLEFLLQFVEFISLAFVFRFEQLNFLCFADRASWYKFSKWPTRRTITLFYNTFITVLYVFRAMSCSSSSGGQIILIQHLVSSLSVSGRPTATYREWLYQVLYYYNLTSWWWARRCSKHIEDCNKRTIWFKYDRDWFFFVTIIVHHLSNSQTGLNRF